MGFSANQARFLSLTSRQVDLEYRMQQICHRRIRIASELENIATEYNNAMSDRKLFASTQTIYEGISLDNIEAMGYKVINNNNNFVTNGLGTITTNYMKSITPTTTGTAINSTQDFLDLVDGGFDVNTDYYLTGNIDLNSTGRTFNDALFAGTYSGTFDGNGYSIAGLDINANTNNVGVFEALGGGGTIRNLSIQDGSVNNTGDNTGILVGRVDIPSSGTATIDNVAIVNTSLTVSGDNAGGIIGNSSSNDSTSISSSYMTGDIAVSGENVGGIIGKAGQTVLANVYMTGNINGDGEDFGGIAGEATSINITDAYNTGNINNLLGYTIENTGGIVGHANGGVSVENTYSSGSISSDGNHTGGIIGLTASGVASIENSYSNGTVTSIGNDYAGGIVGNASVATDISYCYSSASISAAAETGGIAGEMTGGTVDANTHWNSTVIASGIGSNNGATFDATAENNTNTGITGVQNQWSDTAWETTGNPLAPTFAVGETFTTTGAVVTPLEEGLRDGTYCLVREADTFTQEAISISGTDYEKVDWRTIPTIDDDLDVSNDVDAEAKYDSAIEKINSQDKKLQLEQSQIEVEHKAIVTQKDSVKSILDKNIEKSFKSFG